MRFRTRVEDPGVERPQAQSVVDIELPEAKGAADVDSLTQVKDRRFQFLRRLGEAKPGSP
jgi:hypothetical protein